MVIRALTVDLDDTLWDIWPVMKRAEQMVLQFAEQNLPPSVVAALADRDAVWSLRTELLAENPQMANNLSLWRVAAYQRTLERVGLPQNEAEETADRLFQVYFQWRNSVDLFAGVEPVLQQMSGTIRLGSLTNGNADLEAIGIDKYFDFCMSSSDVGSRKPEAQIFIAAAEAAGCAPEQVLHLGDHPEQDVDGARQAGMQALWFNPQGTPWEGSGQPPEQLRQWSDLPDLLQRLQNP